MGRRGLLGRAVAIVVLAAAMLSPTSARADDTVAVLDIRSMHGDDLFARLLTDALREQMKQAPGLRESDRRPSVDTIESVADCEDQSRACAAKALGDNLGADWVVFGTLRRAEGSRDDAFHATLYMYSVRDDAYAASIVAPIPPFDRRTMSERAAAYARALLRKAELLPEEPAAALARSVPPPEARNGAHTAPATDEAPERLGRRARLLRTGGSLVIAGASLSLLSWGAGSARGDDISDGGVIASVAGLGFGFMVGAIGSVVITAGATHDEEPERRDVVVAPAVGPDGASLTGRVTF